MADKINTITKVYFRYFLKNSGVTNPIFERKKIIIGNSNNNPLAIADVFIKLM